MNLFLGQVSYQGVPADEAVVRRTAIPVFIDKAAAVMDDMPEQQELETDSDPQLGMNTRQLASAWHQGGRATPEWIPRVDAVTDSQTRINEQVSSSGTAARREASGIVAPNLSYAVGIEPVSDLNGAKFGNEYFVRQDREVQDTADNTMMTVPPGYDHQNTGQVSAQGKQGARAAATAALYNSFWNGGK